MRIKPKTSHWCHTDIVWYTNYVKVDAVIFTKYIYMYVCSFKLKRASELIHPHMNNLNNLQ